MSKGEKVVKLIKWTHIIKQFWWKKLDDENLLATLKKIHKSKIWKFKTLKKKFNSIFKKLKKKIKCNGFNQHGVLKKIVGYNTREKKF
jgi:hypothetical protein